MWYDVMCIMTYCPGATRVTHVVGVWDWFADAIFDGLDDASSPLFRAGVVAEYD